jgi:hypothetical protein
MPPQLLRPPAQQRTAPLLRLLRLLRLLAAAAAGQG